MRFGADRDLKAAYYRNMKILAAISLLVSLLLLLIFAPLLTGPSLGQDMSNPGGTLAGIHSVYIYVEPLNEEVESKGITDDVLAAEVERRLREAGIAVAGYDSPDSIPGSPTLYLQVNALADEYIEQCTYAIRLELVQAVRLERNPDSTPFHAPTWGVGGVGIHLKGWRQALIDTVIGYVDQFIDAYFLANPTPEE
jgi:hypothetical protein